MSTQFILGKQPYPLWFQQLNEKIIYNTKEDGELISVEIQKSSAPVVAYPGDVIMRREDTVIVIPAKVAEEYGRKS